MSPLERGEQEGIGAAIFLLCFFHSKFKTSYATLLRIFQNCEIELNHNRGKAFWMLHKMWVLRHIIGQYKCVAITTQKGYSHLS